MGQVKSTRGKRLLSLLRWHLWEDAPIPRPAHYHSRLFDTPSYCPDKRRFGISRNSSQDSEIYIPPAPWFLFRIISTSCELDKHNLTQAPVAVRADLCYPIHSERMGINYEDRAYRHVRKRSGGRQKFFVNYLGAVSNDGYHNQTTDFRSYFLTFDDGARLEIMHKPGMEDAPKLLARTGYVHVAFSVGSREKVDELTARLEAGRLPGGQRPQNHRGRLLRELYRGHRGKPDRIDRVIVRYAGSVLCRAGRNAALICRWARVRLYVLGNCG